MKSLFSWRSMQFLSGEERQCGPVVFPSGEIQSLLSRCQCSPCLMTEGNNVLVCLGQSQVILLILTQLRIMLAFTQKCPSLDNKLYFQPSYGRWKLAGILSYFSLWPQHPPWECLVANIPVNLESRIHSLNQGTNAVAATWRIKDRYGYSTAL